MAAIDDILGKGGESSTRKLLQVAPPPTGASLQGAPNSVSSQPTPQTSAPQQPTSAPTSTQPQAQQAPRTDATAVAGNSGTEQPHLSYVQMYEMLNPNKPETAEERAKREKREKSEAAIAAVGDTISALSNLWFTSQYAPNAYDPSKGMSATTKARWDKLRQEREARRREYADGYMRALAMDEAKNREDRNWRHTIEREKIADQRYEIKAAQDKALADLNEQLKRHQITAAEYKAEQERIKAQFAEQNEMLDLGYKQAGIQQRRAAAGASNASAGASNAKANYYRNGGSGGRKNGPTLQLEDDEPMHFGDDKDYDRAVMRLTPDYGVPTTTVEVTEKDRKGNPKKQRTVKRDVKDIAADIEREAAKRKKNKVDNKTMPGVGGGNANTMPGVK
ncbi:hypothetical protein [uncultured Duncaniella sp.]|uniref:hypothetical protein n=1 Tax=uncultured Duncaniella sp. TaxID=2768039 RepID=UPI00262D52C9|nr:hypothetical protein [uncultured Duncaniella sp.]